MKLKKSMLFIAILLTGLYAGIGFFGIMGFNPTILKMTVPTFAEYWQHTDHYMAARMRIFGPLLLLTLLTTALVHIREWRTLRFWFLLTAFFILVTDAAFALNVNHPLNQVVQSWDLNNLPANVNEVKLSIVDAFWFRNALMIGCFICVVIAVFLRRR